MDNEFLFPSINSLNQVDPGRLLTAYVKTLDLQEPSKITCTNLRKNLATKVQMLDMNDTEIDWVCGHLVIIFLFQKF